MACFRNGKQAGIRQAFLDGFDLGDGDKRIVGPVDEQDRQGELVEWQFGQRLDLEQVVCLLYTSPSPRD